MCISNPGVGEDGWQERGKLCFLSPLLCDLMNILQTVYNLPIGKIFLLIVCGALGNYVTLVKNNCT